MHVDIQKQATLCARIETKPPSHRSCSSLTTDVSHKGSACTFTANTACCAITCLFCSKYHLPEESIPHAASGAVFARRGPSSQLLSVNAGNNVDTAFLSLFFLFPLFVLLLFPLPLCFFFHLPCCETATAIHSFVEKSLVMMLDESVVHLMTLHRRTSRCVYKRWCAHSFGRLRLDGQSHY